MSPLSCSHGIMSHTLSFCILKHFADASSMTIMWTPAFVNTVLDHLKEIQLAVRSGKRRFCFVSRDASSVVKTVNAVGLSVAGSGTLNDRQSPFPSDKTWHIHIWENMDLYAASLDLWNAFNYYVIERRKARRAKTLHDQPVCVCVSVYTKGKTVGERCCLGKLGETTLNSPELYK